MNARIPATAPMSRPSIGPAMAIQSIALSTDFGDISSFILACNHDGRDFRIPTPKLIRISESGYFGGSFRGSETPLQLHGGDS